MQARLWTGAVETVGKAIRACRKQQPQAQDQDPYREDLHAHKHLLRASTHMGERQARLMHPTSHPSGTSSHRNVEMQDVTESP
ncbi:hypothetical protein BGX24_008990 [Mortierella sp. AD032]|nr:hypothetical protein BGX24_008990 [Mortierella sp. AD032]